MICIFRSIGSALISSAVVAQKYPGAVWRASSFCIERSQATAMSLHPRPVSIPEKRDLNRQVVDSEARPDFVLASGPERPEKHLTTRKKTRPAHPARPIAPVHRVGRTVKSCGPQKLSVKGRSLDKTL